MAESTSVKKVFKRSAAVIAPVITEFKEQQPELTKIFLMHLIGRTIESATQLLNPINWVLRVVRIDGRALMVADDYMYGRISVTVIGDKIVGIENVEGAPEVEEIVMPV